MLLGEKHLNLLLKVGERNLYKISAKELWKGGAPKRECHLWGEKKRLLKRLRCTDNKGGKSLKKKTMKKIYLKRKKKLMGAQEKGPLARSDALVEKTKR